MTERLTLCRGGAQFNPYVTKSSTSLNTGAKSNPGDKVLGEAEKDSFICQAKGDIPGFCLEKLCDYSRKLDEGF